MIIFPIYIIYPLEYPKITELFLTPCYERLLFLSSCKNTSERITTCGEYVVLHIVCGGCDGTERRDARISVSFRQRSCRARVEVDKRVGFGCRWKTRPEILIYWITLLQYCSPVCATWRRMEFDRRRRQRQSSPELAATTASSSWSARNYYNVYINQMIGRQFSTNMLRLLEFYAACDFYLLSLERRGLYFVGRAFIGREKT